MATSAAAFARGAGECSTSYGAAPRRAVPARARAVRAAAPPRRHAPHGGRRGAAMLAAAAAAAAPAAASGAAPQPLPARGRTAEAAAKAALLSAVEWTRRGANTTPDVRGAVEEAQVALETLLHDNVVDFDLLPGTWRLVYTTAPDVVPIVGLDLSRLLPAGLPAPVVVGDVFQRFSVVDDGRVENVIQFGLPPFTDERAGVTFTVGAKCGAGRGGEGALA
jgi:hypothetical protein